MSHFYFFVFFFFYGKIALWPINYAVKMFVAKTLASEMSMAELYVVKVSRTFLNCQNSILDKNSTLPLT